MEINSIVTSSAPQPAPAAALPAKPPVDNAAAPPAPPPPSQEQLQKALDSVKQMAELAAPNSLEFTIDGDSGKTIVRVTDAKTGEMIRQIPSKELLEIARSLDKLQGMLLRQEA